MKKVKRRVISSILSLVIVCSIATMAVSTASAADLPSTGDKTTDTIIKTEYAIGTGLIRQYVPGGQAIVGALDAIMGGLSDKGPSLSDINDNINKLRAEISKEFSDIKNQMNNNKKEIENKIVDQTVIANKGSNFDTLMSSMKETASQIDTFIKDTSLNEKERAIEIAALIGRNDKWTNSSNVHNQYLSFMNTLSSTSFADQKGRDFCQVVFNDCKSNFMFSGEAIDVAKPYLDRVMLLGTYAYSIDCQCLKAAQDISKFTAEDKKELDEDALEKLSAVKSRTSVINNEINKINDKMFDAGASDSVTTHYKNFNKTSRTIFINKNTTNQPFKKNLKEFNHWFGVTGSGAFNKIKNDICANTISKGDMEALIKYIQTNHEGTSLRDYLKKVGFNVNRVSTDSYMTYAGGNSESINYYIVGFEYICKATGYDFDTAIKKSSGNSPKTCVVGKNGINRLKSDSWNYVCNSDLTAIAFDPA